MKIITLSNNIDKALNKMDAEDYSVINNVQGGYMSVEKALELVSDELKSVVVEAGELWSLIEKLNDVENDAFNDWIDGKIDDETLIECLL